MKLLPLVITSLICLTTLTVSSFSYADNVAKTIEQVTNFRQLSPVFSSSGMPSDKAFIALSQAGYKHVINLIPGDFSEEEQALKLLNISFQQIEVDWHAPTLVNFQNFVTLMKSYQPQEEQQVDEKVLLHCRLNYRASAFAYLYQVTQLGVDEQQAKAMMLSVWQPQDTWQRYIEQVLQHYQH